MIALVGSAFRAGMLAAFLLLMAAGFAACSDKGVQTGHQLPEGQPATGTANPAVEGGQGTTNGGGIANGSACTTPTPTITIPAGQPTPTPLPTSAASAVAGCPAPTTGH